MYESRSLVLLGFTEIPSPNLSENLIWKSWLNSSSHLRAGVFREYSNVFFSHSKAKGAVTGFPLATVVASLTLNDNALLVSGYIQRQQDEIDKAIRHENSLLPLDLDYQEVPGLSNEVIAKLNNHKPETVGQASRISGITPAAISILLVHLKKRGLLRKSA